jgi:hypothetical protein
VVKDKRKEKRIKEELRVAIEAPFAAKAENGAVLNALTQDVSLGGARILTNELFPVGTSLKMTLYLSRTRQIIRVQSEVRWTREVEPGLYEMGVEFQHSIPLNVMALINHLYGKERHLSASVQAHHQEAG